MRNLAIIIYYVGFLIRRLICTALAIRPQPPITSPVTLFGHANPAHEMYLGQELPGEADGLLSSTISLNWVFFSIGYHTDVKYSYMLYYLIKAGKRVG